MHPAFVPSVRASFGPSSSSVFGRPAGVRCVERHRRYPRPRIELRRTAERALRQRAQLFQVFE